MSFCQHRLRPRMPRLIYANFAAARKGQLREQAISLILNWIAGNLVTRHLGDKCIHVDIR
jgi:hypothetical protein